MNHPDFTDSNVFQGFIQIRSSQSLLTHLDFVNEDKGYQDLCIVEIDLDDYAKWDQPVGRISKFLLGTPSIDTLTINLRKTSKSHGIRLFRHLRLPMLQNLTCGNIHHSAISNFVARHPNLASLSIGCCSEGVCNLSTLSGSYQLDITELTGPSSCIRGLVSRATKVLHVTWDPRNISEDKDTMLFSRITAVQANILVLSTHFLPEDIEFTGRLTETFPRLSALKLVEAPRRNEHVSSSIHKKPCAFSFR